VIFVVIWAVHRTVLPPGLPVPLHWLMVTGRAGLTVEPAGTLQSMVPPPPLAEPLHCVMSAPVVFAGKGSQVLLPPPPCAEPLHWFTVTPLTGVAPGVSELMLFVMCTVHVVVWAASLPEPLHWLTLVTRSVDDVVVGPPLPSGHGSSEHCRVTVTVDPRVAPSIVFTIVTSQVIPVVAPLGPAPTSLHCEKPTLAALAAPVPTERARAKLPSSSRPAAPARNNTVRKDDLVPISVPLRSGDRHLTACRALGGDY
jgi:hypothetical protein